MAKVAEKGQFNCRIGVGKVGEQKLLCVGKVHEKCSFEFRKSKAKLHIFAQAAT